MASTLFLITRWSNCLTLAWKAVAVHLVRVIEVFDVSFNPALASGLSNLGYLFALVRGGCSVTGSMHLCPPPSCMEMSLAEVLLVLARRLRQQSARGRLAALHRARPRQPVTCCVCTRTTDCTVCRKQAITWGETRNTPCFGMGCRGVGCRKLFPQWNDSWWAGPQGWSVWFGGRSD